MSNRNHRNRQRHNSGQQHHPPFKHHHSSLSPSHRQYSDETHDDDDDDQDGLYDEQSINGNHAWPIAAAKQRSAADSSLTSITPTWLSQSRVTVLAHWQPQRLGPPKVDPALYRYGALARSAEVFRYTLCQLEYWISPGGVLREWLRLNVRLALLVAVPAALVVPLITLLLAQLSIWVTHLTETTSKIVLFPLSALLILGLVASLVYLAKTLHLPWHFMRRQRRYRYDPENYYGE